MLIDPVSIALGGAAGAALGAFLSAALKKGARNKIEQEVQEQAERNKQRIIDEARAEIAKLKADESESQLKRRKDLEREQKTAQDELREADKRLQKREDMLDRKLVAIEKKEQDVQRLEQQRQEQIQAAETRKQQLDLIYAEEKSKLQSIAGLTIEQAKQLLLERVKSTLEIEVAEMTSRAVNRAKEHAQEDSRKIILNTIQRVASDFVAENTVASIDLPSDDMKGRIIGREGRNIRAFEKVTGVDVIVDDTPGVVVLSCFEPVRREIAKLTMEKLIADGRIHPTRIEEAKLKSEQEVTANIEKLGKDSAIEFGCHDLHPRLRNLLGRLRYRTSYGQNVLAHSKEVAHICGLLAGELKLDTQLAKRCGLLHDCGKALDQEMEGTHPQIGMAIAREVNERVEVCEAIGGHHGDIEVHSLYPTLVTVADAISAARPGARRESLDKYVQRMKKLEEIATTKKGIEKAFAIQAGREIRVLAKAEELSDAQCLEVAREIAKQIENELTYPGEVRVTLIRESRFIEYAR